MTRDDLPGSPVIDFCYFYSNNFPAALRGNADFRGNSHPLRSIAQSISMAFAFEKSSSIVQPRGERRAAMGVPVSHSRTPCVTAFSDREKSARRISAGAGHLGSSLLPFVRSALRYSRIYRAARGLGGYLDRVANAEGRRRRNK